MEFSFRAFCVFFCRLHSAGHLLDICMRKVGLSHLEPGKGYHFLDGYDVALLCMPFGVVSASVLSYNEAAEWCGGVLPSYIPTDSSPRIVKLGDHPGCPCGGTHVADIADIRNVTVRLIWFLLIKSLSSHVK
ncbi:hypothetical protein GW17_00001976 [Ensete ventricosum]|uniref:Uncharacterized protein n=1 Tax=Ensete ventricosum TaxID=4639 RepID=A0A444GEM6_ENSVE|nr:hypothetical protein B296_00032870 [Ensete ventricosum]RWW33322.1 hypothetical protein GW17_00001976 [Ensete ventricosum]RZR78362.1 hypothetical protein BHM03_00003661 [Ensete ventricosum]